MRIEKRDVIRWIKKGWLLLVLQALVTLVITNFLSLASFSQIRELIIENPTGAIGAIFALGLFSVIWGLVIYPMVSGFLLEEIDKRVRK